VQLSKGDRRSRANSSAGAVTREFVGRAKGDWEESTMRTLQRGGILPRGGERRPERKTPPRIEAEKAQNEVPQRGGTDCKRERLADQTGRPKGKQSTLEGRKLFNNNKKDRYEAVPPKREGGTQCQGRP